MDPADFALCLASMARMTLAISAVNGTSATELTGYRGDPGYFGSDANTGGHSAEDALADVRGASYVV